MPETTPSQTEIDARIVFHEADEIMEVSFQDLRIETSADVNAFYDRVEERIAETGEPLWFFLVNYEDTRIQAPAWVRYAARGKRLNEAWSLGSVRYAPGSETETDIRLRAESQGFRPNIRNSRTEALERIDEMKRELL